MGVFLEELLPVNFEYGASFKQNFAVQILTTASGNEYRRLVHPFVRLDYKVSFKHLEDGALDDIVSFIEKTNGGFRGFRVRDLADYSTNNFKDVPTASDMKMIPCDSAGVALSASGISGGYTHAFYVRWYGDHTDAYCARRYLKKINDGNYNPLLSFKAGSVYTPLVLGSDFTVDKTTGIVTLASTRTVDDLYGGCEFDIPCRFDETPNVVFSSYNVLTVNGVDLVEIFNP